MEDEKEAWRRKNIKSKKMKNNRPIGGTWTGKRKEHERRKRSMTSNRIRLMRRTMSFFWSNDGSRHLA